MLLVAFRAKNISPLHWLVVLGLTRRVANRVCGIAVCDSGEKYFAPTLIGGVGAYGLGCEQGARCLWFAIRAKNISPLHWLLLGLTGRVANRVCGVAGCDRGEKDFGRTLGCALGGRAIKYINSVGDRLTMRQPSAQGL